MIIDLFDPLVHQFLKEIENLGFSLCLVGGISRDYFYNYTQHSSFFQYGKMKFTNDLYAQIHLKSESLAVYKLGTDVDIEIRSSDALGISDWDSYYRKLHAYLNQRKLIFIELPYLITRVQFSGMSFEFSSPRIEKALPNNFTHHYFEASLDPSLSYFDSFKRRDLTINSIGIELNFKSSNVEKIIDPFGGIEDLKNKVLRNITEDFFLDPVRFLRLIRFKIKFSEFVIDENLLKKFNLFNLNGLTIHYFSEELFKTRPHEFLNLFSHFVLSQKLNIPKEFVFFTKYVFPDSVSTKDEILAFVFLQNEFDAEKVISFFSLSPKKIAELRSFINSYKAASRVEKKELVDIMRLPLQNALDHKLFKDLKNLEDKKQWCFILNLKNEKKNLLISWEDWNDVVVVPSELNLIQEQYRSYYKYYKTLQKIIKC